MNRRKGVAIAIIAVVAAIGALTAYANMPRQEESSPPPVLTTIENRDNERKDESTTIAEAPSEQTQHDNGTIIANNTVIANNTIVIDKPVYYNNTIIYQPVTIDLGNYRTTINEYAEQENDKKSQLADTSHSITVNAKKIKAEGWSARFSDDRVGMFIAVYDINGNLVKTGYADEHGFKVEGLEDKLYFVFPADCTNCVGKNDIVFRQWEDGSKDRPRLVPANSEVTASYGLVVPKKLKQIPLTPPPSETSPKETPPANETETAADPEVTLQAQNATFVYGWVQIMSYVDNKVNGFEDFIITVYRPDGTLHDSFSYSDQQGFFVSRDAGEGDYRIVAAYEYGNGTVEAEIKHPIKFAMPRFAYLEAIEESDDAVRLNGMIKGGIAGENITIVIHAPNGEQLKKYGINFGTKPVFTLFIPSDEASAIFNSTGNYTFAVTHHLTGVTGNTTLFHDANQTETAAAPLNVSDNLGRSAQASVMAQESDVYLVWEDNTSSQHEILFAKSEDAGETFSEPVAISHLEEGGFVQDPDIAVSGDNIYIVWADYDSEEESTAAFIMSSDGGKTFGNKTVLGERIGEGANPRIALFRGNVYVSWITDSEEEFTGNLMLARSSNGIDFEAAPVAQEVDAVSMASTGERIYLTWRHYPTGDSSEDYVNIIASSGNGIDFETAKYLEGIAVTSLAASSDNNIYAAGFANETVIFAKSSDANTFNTTEISNGTLAHVAVTGDTVYLAWVQDDDIFVAVSSDGGETFGEAENVSNSEGISYWPEISTAEEGAYLTWTEGISENTDIMIVVP